MIVDDDLAFEDWLTSRPSKEELLDAKERFQCEAEKLFTPGTIQSFYRNRYEIYDAYVMRVRRINEVVKERFPQRQTVTEATAFD